MAIQWGAPGCLYPHLSICPESQLSRSAQPRGGLPITVWPEADLHRFGAAGAEESQVGKRIQSARSVCGRIQGK
jgi:hypothetical protein